jgi:peptide/nickel transport system permease protein
MNARWLVQRLLLMVPTLWAATIVVFLMMHLAPGDPAQAMLGPMASAQALAGLRAELGLNDPLYVQYGHWFANMVHGDLGRSIRQQLPVRELVFAQFQNTLILGLAGFTIAVLGGIGLGFVAALRRGSWLDRGVIVLASSGLAIPSFFLALVLAYLFGNVFNILPTQGMHSLDSEDSVVDLLRHLVLPAIALAVGPIAVVARMTRSSTLEVLGQDYVRTARGKGLAEQVIAWRHLLQNSLIPIVHLLGLQAGILLSATALVEVVFSWPGVGALMVQSILTRDLPLTQGCVLLIAGVYALVSVMADAAHMKLDPRIHTA